ncbi:MAG: prolipoprotein diacylglyceryl transferase [Alphaproteobacteria bacterium]|nr:prolipoprotein diacylglyceryl transferase [Alphaproteobacteria bacterium]
MQALIPFPDISPEIFSISLGPVNLALRWYALAYITGLLLAWRWIVALVNRPDLWRDNKAPIAAKQVEDLLTWVILGVILGGRLGYVLFYQPAYYWANPLEIPMVWQGGMSFHGGFLGVIVAGTLFARKYKLSIAGIGDSFAATVAIGLFLGRIANFINGELWGRPTDVPWAVVFPGTLANICSDTWVGVCSRHPSQLYEAALEGILLGLIMAYLVYRRGWLKIPGQLTGMLFIVYGAARSFVELFRQADAQFASFSNPMGYVIRFGVNIDSWGLTMGQVLSLPMIVLGLFIIWLARRNVRRAA